MILNVQLRSKVPEIITTPCEVVFTVELTPENFEEFRTNTMCDYPFIRERLMELEASEPGVTPCIMVLCEGAADGILVDPEGYEYARYTAYIPNARMMVDAEQRMAQSQQDNMDMTL